MRNKEENEIKIHILKNTTIVFDFPNNTTYKIDGDSLKNAIILRYKNLGYPDKAISHSTAIMLKNDLELIEYIKVYLEWDLLKKYLICTNGSKKRGKYKIDSANITIKRSSDN